MLELCSNRHFPFHLDRTYVHEIGSFFRSSAITNYINVMLAFQDEKYVGKNRIYLFNPIAFFVAGY